MQLREFRKTKWYGGLSDSIYTPTDNTFEKGYNVDIFSNPGVAQISPLMSKDSGATVTDLCNFGFVASNGNTYWFSSGGKIYQRTSAGAWTNVATITKITFGGATAFLKGDTITGNVTGATVLLIGAVSTSVFMAIVLVTGFLTTSWRG